MQFPTAMMQDSVWMDRLAYVNAEEHYQLHLTGHLPGGASSNTNSNANANTNTSAKPAPVPPRTASPLISEISSMRENIKSSLSGMANVDNPRIAKLEEENKSMRKLIDDLTKQIAQLTTRVEKLEKGSSTSSAPTAGKSAAVSKKDDDDEDDDDFDLFADEEPAATKKKVDKAEDDDDDDDFDIFGDDDEEEEETEEEKKKKEEVLQKYHEKKSKKAVVIAKSNIVLFVKPWDDETDMAEMERLVRTVQMDGLLWGNAKLVPVGYGINKLQISCVVEDEKVGSEILIEEITTFEDYVQSVDVAAFNKI